MDNSKSSPAAERQQIGEMWDGAKQSPWFQPASTFPAVYRTNQSQWHCTSGRPAKGENDRNGAPWSERSGLLLWGHHGMRRKCCKWRKKRQFHTIMHCAQTVNRYLPSECFCLRWGIKQKQSKSGAEAGLSCSNLHWTVFKMATRPSCSQRRNGAERRKKGAELYQRWARLLV